MRPDPWIWEGVEETYRKSREAVQRYKGAFLAHIQHLLLLLHLHTMLTNQQDCTDTCFCPA